MKKLFILLLLFLCSCATTQYDALQKRVTELEDQLLLLQASGVGATTNMYGRICTTGTNCLEDISANDGDLGLVINSSESLAFYKYASSSALAANGDWVVDDANLGGSERWEMITGFTVRNNGSTAGAVTLYELYGNGQNYYGLNVPDSITTNATFEVGLNLQPSAQGDSSKSLTRDDCGTLYIVNASAMTVDRTYTLPEASTVLGCVFGFFLTSANGTYDFRVDPNDGTDTILGASAGEYIEAATPAGNEILLVQAVEDDIWVVLNMVDTSTPTWPTGWTEETP